MRYFICLLISFQLAHVYGQNLSGIWQGKLIQEPGGCFPEYFIELQIQSTDKEISGVSYDYYDTSLFVKLNFTGGFNQKSKTILITEKKVIKERIPEDCAPCLKTYDLTYNNINNEESLTGKWLSEATGLVAGCPPGFISLKKVKESAFEGRRRETELVQSFVVDSADVQIDLLDNGVVDGDSISVMFNNQVVVSKKGLSLAPIIFNYSLEPLKEYKMVVVSESVGSISPTTALVIITAGSKRYEVFISSDQKKSSSIGLIYKKK